MGDAIAAAAVLPSHSLRRELARKAFHVASVLLAAAAWALPRTFTVPVFVGLLGIALLVEALRFRSRFCRYHFLRYTRTMLRPCERHGFAGATYMILAYTIALVFFPRPIAVAAMLFNGLGDAAAAVVGKRLGRHRTWWGKSWEGASAGVATNLGIALAIPGVPLIAAVTGAAIAGTLEFAPLPLDDNVRVTLGGAFGIMLVRLLV